MPVTKHTRRVSKAGSAPAERTIALRIAREKGLLAGPKTKHFNVKVAPALFEAAAKRVGSTSPSVVVNAALAALAAEDELGPWLARNSGIWRDLPEEILKEMEF